jgi:leader peptidase (prepilin peptidase) / N-methyltransferase
MTGLLVGGCAFLGLFIGSFLNVVIHRVPKGESVVSPRSRCPGCEQEIAWYDNLPVISWLILRGRCRSCHEPIAWRYPAVEVLTALVFGSLAWALADQPWAVPAYLWVGGVGVALAAIDIEVKRLPDVITLPSYLVVVVLLVAPAIAYDAWSSYLRSVLGAVALWVFYFLLAFLKPGAMGFGDVKLAGVLGLVLGWLGWGVLILGGFLGFLLGGVLGLLLMLLGRAGRKSKIPFGPFMLAGAWLAVLWGPTFVNWYLDTLRG